MAKRFEQERAQVLPVDLAALAAQRPILKLSEVQGIVGVGHLKMVARGEQEAVRFIKGDPLVDRPSSDGFRDRVPPICGRREVTFAAA